MSPKVLQKGIVVVLLSSVLGIFLGQVFVRVAIAQGKVRGKQVRSVQTASSQISSQCPTIKYQPLTVAAEDYSATESIPSQLRHPDSENATANMQITGLPDGTTVPVTLSVNCSYSIRAQTIVTNSNPNLSFSIALSGVSASASIGTYPLFNGSISDLSRGGNDFGTSGTLQQNTYQTVVMLGNGAYPIILSTGASAITSNVSNVASAYVMLDLIDVSFGGVVSANASRTTKLAATNALKQCPDQCGQLTQSIEDIIADLKSRYNALLSDQHNEYCKNYFNRLILDGEDKGSYFGHMIQFEERQRSLIKKSNLAGAQGCIVPEEAVEWAYKAVPDQPSMPLCHSPGG